jgi:hypothetical protein
MSTPLPQHPWRLIARELRQPNCLRAEWRSRYTGLLVRDHRIPIPPSRAVWISRRISALPQARCPGMRDCGYRSPGHEWPGSAATNRGDRCARCVRYRPIRRLLVGARDKMGRAGLYDDSFRDPPLVGDDRRRYYPRLPRARAASHGKSAHSALCQFDEARAPGAGAGGQRSAQQAVSLAAGDQWLHPADSSWPGHAENAGPLGRRSGEDGRDTESALPRPPRAHRFATRGRGISGALYRVDRPL